MTDRLELLMAETLDRVKELANEVRRLRDLIEEPDLPPVKVSAGNQPVVPVKNLKHAYFAARP